MKPCIRCCIWQSRISRKNGPCPFITGRPRYIGLSLSLLSGFRNEFSTHKHKLLDRLDSEGGDRRVIDILHPIESQFSLLIYYNQRQVSIDTSQTTGFHSFRESEPGPCSPPSMLASPHRTIEENPPGQRPLPCLDSTDSPSPVQTYRALPVPA